MAKRQKRFEVLEQRPVNKDGFIKEWVEVGLVAMDSPNDPKPGIKIEGGRVTELDGKRRDDFDMIDTWIANHCIDTSVAEEAMGRSLTPGEVSAYFTGRSLDYIRSQPGDWLKLTGKKFALTWNATEILDTEDQYGAVEPLHPSLHSVEGRVRHAQDARGETRALPHRPDELV